MLGSYNCGIVYFNTLSEKVFLGLARSLRNLEKLAIIEHGCFRLLGIEKKKFKFKFNFDEGVRVAQVISSAASRLPAQAQGAGGQR